MRRFRIEATWHDGPEVRVEFERIESLSAEQVARMRASGMLRADDEPVGGLHLGQLVIEDPIAMTPKRVRRMALRWLAENAGMTETDSYEMQIAVRADLEALARLEALGVF